MQTKHKIIFGVVALAAGTLAYLIWENSKKDKAKDSAKRNANGRQTNAMKCPTGYTATVYGNNTWCQKGTSSNVMVFDNQTGQQIA